MSFNPGGGGGISGATDVAFSSVADDQVLTYDAAIAKWRNENAPAGDLSAHTAASDPHATAKYAIMPDGGRHVWTRTTPPSAADGAVDGDVWAGPES